MTNKQRLPLSLTNEPLKIELAAYLARPFLYYLRKSFMLLHYQKLNKKIFTTKFLFLKI